MHHHMCRDVFVAFGSVLDYRLCPYCQLALNLGVLINLELDGLRLLTLLDF